MDNWTGRQRVFRATTDILIVLSVAATFVEEAALVAGAPWGVRNSAALACVALDVFFMLEFAVRLGRALVDRRLSVYMGAEAGWLDALAAVPPLVFTSGPFLFDAAIGLQTTVAISAMGNFRLLRGLGFFRSFRLLRLFNPDRSNASMSGRPHVRAATFALCASLAVLVGAEAASILGLWPDAHEALAHKRAATMSALAASPDPDSAEAVAAVDGDLLLVRVEGAVIYTRFTSEEYRRRYGPDEIGYLAQSDSLARQSFGLEAFFDLTGELKAQAASALAAGLCAVAVLTALALSFRRGKSGELEALPGPDEAGGEVNGEAGGEVNGAAGGEAAPSERLDIDEDFESDLAALGIDQEAGSGPAGADELEGLLGPSDSGVRQG